MILIQEASELTVEEVKDKISKMFYKYFPKSLYKVSNKNSLGGGDIHFVGFLGKDKSEWQGGYADNDPLSLSFWVWGTPETGVINQEQSFKLEWSQASIAIKPDSPHMAYGRVKLPLRKATAPIEKLLSVIEKAFATTYKVVKDNKDNFINLSFDIESKL
jgi:hypothetical protein